MNERIVTQARKTAELLYSFSNVYFVSRRAHIFGNLPKKRSKLALEIGCGDRILWTRLLSKRSDLVIAVDLFGQKVSKSKQLASRPQSTLDNVVWVVADATALPFRDDIFDSVICVDVIEHIPDHAKLVSEISRVMNESASAVITTMREDRRHYFFPLVFSNHVREYTPASLKEVCLSAPVAVAKEFSFYGPMATIAREVQLKLLARLRIPNVPVVRLLLNLPLGIIALIAERFTREGGGIGVVIRRAPS